MTDEPIKPIPRPLDRNESEQLWRYERALMRAGAMAVLLLAAGLGIAALYGEAPWIKAGVVGAAAALIIGGLVLQTRERCPRCGGRVATIAALTPPERCRTCGVAFPRPEHIDAELDN